jgi:TPR repeat protein
MKRFAVLFVLSMLTSLLAIGCSSPKQKVEKCQKKVCSKLKSHGKKLCNSVCENKYYRDFDDEKLDSLCSDGDDIACLRASTKAFKKKDYKTVANNLKKCASKKNATCIGLMGNMYKSGKGVKKDKTKALAMFEEACEKGNYGSCASAGFIYMDRKELGRAKELFSDGCQHNARTSCSMLGVLYRDGRGVKRDVTMAKKYMRKACDLDYKAACRALRRL